MFGILINEENMPKILEREIAPYTAFEACLANSKDWYFISGYVNAWGKVYDFSVLPQYILEQSFVFDPVKIKTDWDQIVRKEG